MMHVRVGGVWLNSVAPWGGLTWSTDERGCKEASFTVGLGLGRRNPVLTRGALVEIMFGSLVIWSGQLEEPDWSTGTFHARGFAYQAEDFLALDGSLAATSTPSVAVDQAIADGWAVTRHSTVPTTAFTSAAEGSNSVGSLLDANADELAKRWSVRADRVLRFESDTTTPSWQLRPGVVELGNASDDYASGVVVTYQSAVGIYSRTRRIDANAAAEFGPKFIPLDLSKLGVMSLARANGYGDAVLAKGRARLGWISSIDVTRYDLLNMGAVPADLPMVQAGEMVRIHGEADDMALLGGHSYIDVVIGSTSYVDGSEVLSLSPLGSVSQTLSEVIAELTEEAA